MSIVGRRRFLGGALGVLAAITAPVAWVSRAFGATTGVAATPAEKVARFFTDDAGAARIGAAYVAAVPQEGEPDFLVTALTPAGETPDTWWAGVTVPELRRIVRAAAHTDFEAGTVADVEGWQLARTEARLAALFSLTR
jgi:hypothetical protein